MKVCFCATHYTQFNGYAKVAYELIRRLGTNSDFEITYYGFQNFHAASAKHSRVLPETVVVHDATEAETPKEKGFGLRNMASFFSENEFDIVVVYNDMIIVNAVIEQVRKSSSNPKIVAYLDQVYPFQKPGFVQNLNEHCDAVLAFNPYWVEVIRKQGVTRPIISYLRHAVDPQTYFPIPKDISRKYFGLNQDDFIVLNLNRNQPRKRWDICLQAFAEAVSRVRIMGGERTLKLLVATSLTGAWNLLEIFERELNKRGISLEEGKQHLIVIDAPQRLPDCDINVLMNCADVAINTCDGEGFGLCQFESASIGVPQIVPELPAFMDYLKDGFSLMVNPTMSYYVDSSRDGVGGEGHLCLPEHFADSIVFYYNSPNVAAEHGLRAREAIASNPEYRWDKAAERLAVFLKTVMNAKEVEPEVDEPPKEIPPPADSADSNKDRITIEDLKGQLEALTRMVGALTNKA